jgi:hypothetical protein
MLIVDGYQPIDKPRGHTMSIDKDRIEGSAEQAKGKAKEIAGHR